MKRRTFLKSMAGLFAATQIPNALANTESLDSKHPMYVLGPDGGVFKAADTQYLPERNEWAHGWDKAKPNSDETIYYQHDPKGWSGQITKDQYEKGETLTAYGVREQNIKNNREFINDFEFALMKAIKS